MKLPLNGGSTAASISADLHVLDSASAGPYLYTVSTNELKKLNVESNGGVASLARSDENAFYMVSGAAVAEYRVI